MVTVEIDGKVYSLKQSYKELTRKQYAIVSHVRASNLMQLEQNQIEFNAIRINLFYFLSNIPLRKIRWITSAEWVDLFPYINWVFNTPDLDQNPIQWFNLRFKTYYGPIGMLDNSTMEEFSYADTSFTVASNGNDLEHMYKIVSFLYRPSRRDLAEFKNSEKWNGDIREPFNYDKSKRRLKLFKKMKFRDVVGVYLYFSAFRKYCERNYPELFKKSSSGSGSSKGWAEMLLEVSHLPVFGTVDQVSIQNCHTVLFELNRQLEIQAKRNLK